MNEKKEWPPMQLGWNFSFGKHKGETLLDVIDDDVDYINWAIGKEIITLDNDASEYLRNGGVHGKAI